MNYKLLYTSQVSREVRGHTYIRTQGGGSLTYRIGETGVTLIALLRELNPSHLKCKLQSNPNNYGVELSEQGPTANQIQQV